VAATQLFIEGKIQTRSWDDRASGAKKYRTEILIDELTLLGNRQGGGDGSSGTQPRSNARQFGHSRASTTEEYAYTSEGITDADIPF
jgi:single-strand DNA-binding protein